MNTKRMIKKVISFALVSALFLTGIWHAPTTVHAAGWPDYAKDVTLGNAVTGSVKDGDYYGKFNNGGLSCYWHIYRFSMPAQGHLKIHVESQNQKFLDTGYYDGTGSSKNTYYTIFPVSNPDSCAWNYKFSASSYSSAREMYYNSVTIAMEEGEYYFAVRAYVKLDLLYYLTLSYEEPRFPVTSISFDKPKLKMQIGTKQTIQAAVLPDNATDKTLAWKSTAPSVAKVENGTVEALSIGTASVIASSADGETQAVCEVTVTAPPDGYEYRVLEDGSAEITRYDVEDASVTVPHQMDGCAVTSIGDFAFQNVSGLSELKLLEGLKTVGRYSFQNCESLAGVELPNGVAAVGEYAFQNCKSLASVSLPESLSSIGAYAFQNCESLASVDLPRNLTAIPDSAFQNCSGLKSVGVPGKLVSIGRLAFASCSSIESAKLPAGLSSIGDYGFYGCSSLKDVAVPQSVKSIGTSAFSGCAAGLTLTVEKGSYAETYAKSNNIKYKYVDESSFEAKPANPCAHSYKKIVTPATMTAGGSITEKCSKCGDEKSMEAIDAIRTAILSKTSYAYNGKTQKPSVIVKDSKGKALRNNIDYTAAYPQDVKNVGRYAVIVTFKGNYSGTVKKTFDITPKGTAISRLSAGKRGFSVRWKRQAAQTAGYEISYSTSSRFPSKDTKILNAGNNRSSSKTVSGLKAKKKYYVRIRTYTTVKISGKSVKLYSDWSKAKTVVAKK